MVHMYHCTIMENKSSRAKKAAAAGPKILVERVQTGVRIEKRILKVLKALAEYFDINSWRFIGRDCSACI